MRSFRVALIILAIIIVTGGIFLTGRSVFLKVRKPAENPLKAIPENTALVLRINHPHSLLMELKDKNQIWHDISAVPYLGSLNDQFSEFDSLIRTHPDLFKVFQDNQLFMAVSQTGRSSFGLLFLSPIPGIDTRNDIIPFLEEKFGNMISIHKSKYSNSEMVRLSFSKSQDPFYFAVSEGIFLGSRYPELIRKSIDQLSLNIPSLMNTGFALVETTTGKKVDANIFVNYHLIYPVISRLLQPGQTVPGIEKISAFGNWSGLDVLMKNNEVLINGYTSISDSGTSFLGIFDQQTPQKITLSGILPDNTSRFHWMGFSNIESYYRNFLAFSRQHEGYLEPDPDITGFEKNNEIDILSYVLPWTGNEICFSVATNDENNPREDHYAVVKIKDMVLADSLLRDLVAMTGKRKDTLVYKDVVITSLHLPDLISHVFGNHFVRISSNYYCLLNEAVVFAETPLALKYFIDHIRYEKTLAGEKGFISLGDNLSDNANLYWYFRSDYALAEIKNSVNDDLKMQLETAMLTLGNLESLSIQFSNRDDAIYSTVYINYNPSR